MTAIYCFLWLSELSRADLLTLLAASHGVVVTQ